MKKTILLLTTICTLCFLNSTSNAQTPEWLWAKNPSGSGYEGAKCVAVDASGNTYVAGYFDSPTLTFGSTVLTNTNGSFNYNVFLAKYDASGNVLWAKSGIGINVDQANSVAVDASGNIYIGGTFNSPTLTFGNITLTNSNSSNTIYDLFLAKYDNNGNVLWAKNAVGTLNDGINSVKIDATGNILVAGYTGSLSLGFGNFALAGAAGTTHFFLVKYDSNGNAIWGRNAGSTYSTAATSIAVDNLGNTFITGYFGGYILQFTDALDNLMLSISDPNGSNLYEDIFIAKYDTDGGLLWAKVEGGTMSDKANSISVDKLGNPYITGTFDSPTLSFGSTSLTNVDGSGNNNIFITKYDAIGNVIWAKSAGGTGIEIANAITIDDSVNIYIAGQFKSPTLSFGSTTLTNAGLNDIFLAKYDSNGNVAWAKSMGSTNDDIANSVTVDTSANIYI